MPLLLLSISVRTFIMQARFTWQGWQPQSPAWGRTIDAGQDLGVGLVPPGGVSLDVTATGFGTVADLALC